MKLGISNIAWDPPLDDEVSRVLTSFGLRTVDIAPSKYFDLRKSPQNSEVFAVRKAWEARGLHVWGMQSLMFGSALNVFGTPDEQTEMLDWLNRVCVIGGLLGASYLVFGSPKNRDISVLLDKENQAVASAFFSRLGDIAVQREVTICVEPTPPEYGANFITTSQEAIDFVTRLGHPGIRAQFDTGALILAAEEPIHVTTEFSALIGHVHISAPHLSPIHRGATALEPHLPAIRILAENSSVIPTIEMLTTNRNNALVEIEKSVAYASTSLYPGARGGILS